MSRRPTDEELRERADQCDWFVCERCGWLEVSKGTRCAHCGDEPDDRGECEGCEHRGAWCCTCDDRDALVIAQGLSPVGASLGLPAGWVDVGPCRCEGTCFGCGGVEDGVGRIVYAIHEDGWSVEFFRDDDGLYIVADSADADVALWAIAQCSGYGGDR